MDNIPILEFVIIVVIFGPLPVSFIVWPDHERYYVYGFIALFIIGYLTLAISLWLSVVYLPAAWCFALKPIIRPSDH